MEGSWSPWLPSLLHTKAWVSPRVSTHHDPGQSLGPTWSFLHFRFSLVMFLMLVRAFRLFMEPHKNTINTSVFKLVCGFLLQIGVGGGENFLAHLGCSSSFKIYKFKFIFLVLCRVCLYDVSMASRVCV